MGDHTTIEVGDEVRTTGRISVPAGEGSAELLTRLDEPIDGKGPIAVEAIMPIERIATESSNATKSTRLCKTGIVAIDALTPIGCGQRELVIGDRQTGKTAICPTPSSIKKMVT